MPGDSLAAEGPGDLDLDQIGAGKNVALPGPQTAPTMSRPLCQALVIP